MAFGDQVTQLFPTQQRLSVPKIPGLQILKKIGQGGMAHVYLALQESLQRPVAVKILTSPDTPGFHERFVNEGRYIAALSHSNIVDIHDIGECDGHYYIVMEYLPGSDLKRRIREGIEPRKVMEFAIKMASCLDYLHKQGIVHRDLKPANILFRDDGNPVITDFGIAKILQQQEDLTACGSVMGSPYYLSPEQAISSTDIDGRSDIYSLGIIIYEMLTNQRPFTGENFTAILLAHRDQPIPLLPDNLIQYQPIIELLLPKSPEDRYQNGQELIEDIRNLFSYELDALHEAQDSRKVNFPSTEQLPGRNPNDRLHFDGGWQWFKLLLFSGLLLGITVYTLQLQQNQDVIVLQAKVKGWLFDQETALLDAISVKHQPPLESVEKLSTTQAIPTPAPKQQEQSQQADIDQLIGLAYKRMNALKLSYPVGDSALHYFRKVLKLQPGNRKAKQGINEILHWYIAQAEQAIRNSDLRQAARYIRRGSNINKHHPKLIALKKQLHPPKSAVTRLDEPFTASKF